MLIVVLMLLRVSGYSQVETDTTQGLNLYRSHLINQDSLNTRQAFIRDSIQSREQFVRDSLLRRKMIHDSLTFLQKELQQVLEAIQWTIGDDIISHAANISIVGDSALSDYMYYKLPMGKTKPYTTWKGNVSLNAKHIRLYINKKNKKINAIRSASLVCSLTYMNPGLIIIHEDYIMQKNSSGNFFRYPLDSVFLDRDNKIYKIRRYVQFYDLLPGNKKGELLFTNRTEVRQYQYNADRLMTSYEMVKFCERYKVYEKNDVCSIVKYSVAKQRDTYLVTRRNNPANEFSDGTFALQFDANENVKYVSFRLLNNQLMWQRFVELDKSGNVSCYIDKKDGVTGNTRCMTYHNEPNAKYPVDVINTSFEKDGVDYVQSNLTTGKTRMRDRMTLEWGPWR